MDEGNKINLVSSAAVAAKTGKSWDEWLAVLDADGARDMGHPDIARLLKDKYGVPDWWCQMVTVGYERARGMRDVYQKSDGYSASASKTIAVPMERLYAAWVDEGLRAKWLGDLALTVRRSTPEKSLRILWDDGTPVDVGFYAKGDMKSQVAVQQARLPDAAAVASAKEFWTAALLRLKGLLEG